MWRGLGWDSGAMLRYCHVKTGLRYSMVFFQSNSEHVDRWLLKRVPTCAQVRQASSCQDVSHLVDMKKEQSLIHWPYIGCY